ncbi:MAG: T9SS type A sorting domain-containing protein [Bacteroidota bacterium]
MLCRIYFSAVTDSVICIDNIRDIVNQNTERVVTYVYGGCVPTGSNGVSDVSANSVFQIAPNPVQHQLHLQVKQYADGLSYSISDPSGRIVIGETAINNPTVTIETSGLSSGVYLLQLHSNGQTFMRRFNKL